MEPVWGAACAVMAGHAGPRKRPVEGGGMMRAAVAGEGHSLGLDLPAVTVTYWTWSGKGIVTGLESGCNEYLRAIHCSLIGLALVMT